jgi:hypothetical protein
MVTKVRFINSLTLMIGSFAGWIVVIVEALANDTWPPLTPACARSGQEQGAKSDDPIPPHCRGAPG